MTSTSLSTPSSGGELEKSLKNSREESRSLIPDVKENYKFSGNKHRATSPSFISVNNESTKKQKKTYDIDIGVDGSLMHDVDDSLLSVEEELRRENEQYDEDFTDNCDENEDITLQLQDLLDKCKKYAQFLYSRVQHSLDEEQEHPKYLTGGTLRPHQIQGLRWLRTLYEYGVNGMLADEMGLGKTLQIVSLVCEIYELGTPGPFLIVSPLSALPQWLSEFATFAPSIPIMVCHGDKQTRKKVIETFSDCWYIRKRPVYPTVITTFEIIMIEHHFFQRIGWKLLVVDEGHRLKNWRCKLMKTFKTIETTNRFLLTGTPLQNNLSELWTLLNFLMPEIFNNCTSFDSLFRFYAPNCGTGVKSLRSKMTDSQKSVDKSYSRLDENTVQILHQILSPFMLRRIKANIPEMRLPSKTIKNVFVAMSATQLHYQNLLFEEVLHDLAEKKGPLSIDMNTLDGVREKKAVPRISHLWLELRKLASHPFILEAYDGTDFSIEKVISYGGKFLALSKILPVLSRKGHKTLIFAGMLSTLDYLEDMCAHLSITTCRIDGSMSYTERFDAVRDFFSEEKNKQVFLLSTRAAGLGLNLSAADTVIMFDTDWNPMVDEQAQDRCHRIGQTKPVLILRLICVPSIDEQVLRRARLKSSVEKLVVHPVRGGLESIGLLAFNNTMNGKDLAMNLQKLHEQLTSPNRDDHQNITPLETEDDILNLISR